MTTPADPETGDTRRGDHEYQTYSGRCQNSRTPLEQMLLTLLVVLSTLCAVLVVLLTRRPLVSTLLEPSEFDNENLSCSSRNCVFHKVDVCTTEACVKAAAAFLRNMDQTEDPCSDFYKFACGRWHLNHILPPDGFHYDTFSQMKDELKTTLRVLLEAPIDEFDSNATANVKNLYASCMNESIIEERQEGPLLEILETLGGWPVINPNWTEENFNWVEMMAKLRQLNYDILVGQGVGPDGKNSSINIIQIDQADLGLQSRDYYNYGSEQLAAYKRFMIEVACLLGAPKELAELELNEVVEFEMKIANLTVPNEERRNFSAIYQKMTLKELQDSVPLINWTLYFELITPVTLNETEELVVFALEYLQNISLLVEKSPKRLIANYLLWRFIQNRVGNLDRRFLNAQQNFHKVQYGVQTAPHRWKTCTVYVNKNMGMAVGALFIRAHFNEDSKKKAEEMIADIKEAFQEILEEASWMDNDTLFIAQEKARMMTQKIGYPEYINNSELLDKDFEGVEFKPDTYFENVLNSLRHYALKEQLKLRIPVDKTIWVTSPAVVNAFYTRSKNFISFPAGILQPPLYHQHYPRSINYGGIGVVIGHEITHGFDDKGRQFDQFGNLKQWWQSKALAQFQKQAECMIKQYSNYTVSDIDMNVNGINTQGENIADNGGVKQAFRAYKNWLRRNGEEPLLPGMNLTHDQLFFLNYAQIWCGIMRPEAAINTVRVGAHSPGNFRVIGALSNSKDFAKAYNCHSGSLMNPVEKCEVW